MTEICGIFNDKRVRFCALAAPNRRGAPRPLRASARGAFMARVGVFGEALVWIFGERGRQGRACGVALWGGQRGADQKATCGSGRARRRDGRSRPSCPAPCLHRKGRRPSEGFCLKEPRAQAGDAGLRGAQLRSRGSVVCSGVYCDRETCREALAQARGGRLLEPAHKPVL